MSWKCMVSTETQNSSLKDKEKSSNHRIQDWDMKSQKMFQSQKKFRKRKGNSWNGVKH